MCFEGAIEKKFWPEDLRFFWFVSAVVVSFGFDLCWVLQSFGRSSCFVFFLECFVVVLTEFSSTQF